MTLTGSPSYHNPNSFQIISSGRDRHYGIGGQYLPDANNLKLPFPDAPAGNLDSGWWSAAGVSQENLGSNYRQQFEQENLANFATSRLDQ